MQLFGRRANATPAALAPADFVLLRRLLRDEARRISTGTVLHTMPDDPDQALRRLEELTARLRRLECRTR